jgi:hypothetical protein
MGSEGQAETMTGYIIEAQSEIEAELLMRPAKCARIPLRINGILPENQVIMTDALRTI